MYSTATSKDKSFYDSVLNSAKWLVTMLLLLLFSANSSAQIALRDSNSATTTGTTLTINKPSGLAVGDFMVANIVQSDDDSDGMGNATRSGWTLIAGELFGSSGSDRWYGTLLYRVADASDVAAANFVFNLHADGDDGVGGISAFSGVDLANPFDATPGTINNINTAALSAPSITTTTANAAVIMFGMVGDDRNSGTWNTTSPGSLTELFDEEMNADADLAVGAAWAIKSTAGATGTGTAVLANAGNDPNGAMLIALRRFTGTITTSAIAGSPFCAGNNVSVPFTITGSYAAGNVFTAQLSNAAGSFSSPTAIGTLTSTSAGTISATIPAGQANGTGYRIRVVSSLPPATGTDNGTNIVINAIATATAGSNFNTCSANGAINITAGSSASNFSSVTWTASGLGIWTNQNSLTLATYEPTAADIANGSVMITLTANGNSPCGNASSNKTLTIYSPPTASAGGSDLICSNSTATVSGASSSNGTIAWTENGAGSITAGANTLTPTYTAAVGDGGNIVTLTMTVSNPSCSNATATYTVQVTAAPGAIAGNTVLTCSNSGAVNITSGASAPNSASVMWSSSGLGSFADANSLTLASYTPSASDISAGSVTLTLTVFGNSPCANATSNKTLTIQGIPVTADAVVCQGGTGFLTSSTVCPPAGTLAGGPSFATAGSTSGSGTAWSNPGNVNLNNNSYATASRTSDGISQSLNATNFGFSIPANATILGMQANIARFRSTGGVSGDVQDNSVRLIQGGIAVGTNKGATSTNWPTSEAVAGYGSSSDLWGASWTPAQINASNFGVSLVVDITAFFATRVATVDYIEVTVTYSVPGTFNWYTVSSGGTPIGTGLSFNPVGVPGSGLADTQTPGTTVFYGECSTIAGCRTPTNFTINPLPVVNFSGFNSPYCQNDTAITLTGNQAPGGTFTGPGITDNANGTASFDPLTAGPGTHSIMYAYTDGNTCVNTSSQNVTVIAYTIYYADVDEDGFGNPLSTQFSCAGAPVGYVANNSDCNDNQLQYLDADADGFGSTTIVACGVTNNTDCDDNLLMYSDADNDGFGAMPFVDCNGLLTNTDCNDNQLQYVDADADGFGSTTLAACGVTNNTDCDDNQILYADNDTDGFGSTLMVDCGGVTNNTDCNDNQLQYVDADADGFGSTTFAACGVTNNTDCDDNQIFYADNDIDGFGSTTMVDCGGVTNNTDCNDNQLQYVDADADGFGSTTLAACGVTNNTDCDDNLVLYADNDADGFGSTTMVDCDGVTNNTDCNDNQLQYVDADADGFGSTTLAACGVANNTDCDDNQLQYVDADSDGFGSTTLAACGVTNNTDCNDSQLQYVDADGDGFGSLTLAACGVTNNTDCDDNLLLYADNDADGFGSTTLVDCFGSTNNTDCNDNQLNYSDADGDSFGALPYLNCGGVTNGTDCNDNQLQYLDADNDGFGSATVVACGVVNNTDCNDNNASMNTTFSFYTDADGDTYGAGDLVAGICAVDSQTAPAGYSVNNTDCDDLNSGIYQSGSLYVDADNDGYTSGATAIVCYGSAAPSGYALTNIGIDCNDNASQINPGMAEVLYNGIDDNCNGQLDEGNQLTTQIVPGQCGTTLAAIGANIAAVSKQNVSGYRFEVTNTVTNTVQVIDKASPYFNLTQLASYDYQTTYSIRVMLQKNGIWLGYYGSACLVSSPAVTQPGGAAQVNPSQCGITLASINTLIATTSSAGVTGYRFKITNISDPGAPNQVQQIDRSQHWFNLPMLASYHYGTTYIIEVAIKTNGAYSPFGNACQISSPVVPSINSCGQSIPTPATYIYTTSLAKVTSYRFEITNLVTNQVTTLDRSQNWFTFNMVPGFAPATLYGVRVAVMTSGYYSLFSDACEITSPGFARSEEIKAEVIEKPAFAALAYPNPFADNFTIDVKTSSAAAINIKVYDMTGRILNVMDVEANELKSQQIGNSYPAGVYNVIVTQGDELKTLRVVKR